MLALIAALGHGVQDASRGRTRQRSCRANLWGQGDRDGQKNGSDVSLLSSGVRQDRERKGNGAGAKGRRVGGWVER